TGSTWSGRPAATDPAPRVRVLARAARLHTLIGMTSPGFLPTRQLVLVDLLALMCATNPGQRAVVAVDGPDGVGKTRLVGELVALAPYVAGREVLSVSVDGFHHPRAVRYARGRTAETLYHDSYDYDALREKVLRPFRA